jgi:hypothetical protein
MQSGSMKSPQGAVIGGQPAEFRILKTDEERVNSRTGLSPWAALCAVADAT